MEISKETQHEIVQLQNMQRQLQTAIAQYQRFEFEIIQMDAALAELENAKGKTYKTVGGMLIESNKSDLAKELNDRKGMLKARIETLKKQETRLKERVTELQAKVEKELGTAA